MPGGTRSQLGNELFAQCVYITGITFPTLGANASSSNTLTIPGVLPGDIVGWNMQSPPAHLVLDNIYVSAVNTLTILWSTDATGVTGGSNLAVLFEIARPENSSLGLAALPNSVQ